MDVGDIMIFVVFSMLKNNIFGEVVVLLMNFFFRVVVCFIRNIESLDFVWKFVFYVVG